MSQSYFHTDTLDVCPTERRSKLRLETCDDIEHHKICFVNTSPEVVLTICFQDNRWRVEPTKSCTLVHKVINGKCYWEECKPEKHRKGSIIEYVLYDIPRGIVDVPIPNGAKAMLAVLVGPGAGGEGALTNSTGTLTSRPGMGGGSGALVSTTIQLEGVTKLQVRVGTGGAGGLGSTDVTKTIGGRGTHTSVFLYNGEVLVSQLCAMGARYTNQDAGLIYTGGGAHGGGGPTGSKYAEGSFGYVVNGKPADETKAGDGGGLGRLSPVGGPGYGSGLGGLNKTSSSTIILGGGGGGIGPGELLGAGGNGGTFESAILPFFGPAKGQDGTLGGGGGGGSYFSQELFVGPYTAKDGGKGGDGYIGLTFIR